MSTWDGYDEEIARDHKGYIEISGEEITIFTEFGSFKPFEKVEPEEFFQKLHSPKDIL